MVHLLSQLLSFLRAPRVLSFHWGLIFLYNDARLVETLKEMAKCGGESGTSFDGRTLSTQPRPTPKGLMSLLNGLTGVEGMDGDCYFCKRPLSLRMANKHHKIPQRYFSSKREANANGNVVWGHVDCHAKVHYWHDRPNMSKQKFIQYMEYMNWWEGIYEEAD